MWDEWIGLMSEGRFWVIEVGDSPISSDDGGEEKKDKRK